MWWGDGAYLFGKTVYLKEEQLWFQAAAASWQNSINYKKVLGINLENIVGVRTSKVVVYKFILVSSAL